MQLTKHRPTHDELKAAFDKIANKQDWREPIAAVIPYADFDLYAMAVKYFTATPLRVRASAHTANGYLFVKAAGYRQGPAGDH